MIEYNKYINNEDYTWYNSSNIIFSKCYDNNIDTKTLKLVFKNGRTYVYKDVNVADYVNFKNAQSNGEAVNKYIIKKYQGVRISDTDIEQLNNLRKTFTDEETEVDNTQFSNLVYHLDMCEKTGEFNLKLNDKVIFYGIEDNFSILNLFKSMNLKYSWNCVDEIIKKSDENEDKINIE